MTDTCNPPCGDDGRKGQRDARTIAIVPSIRRWLRTLAKLRADLATRRRVRHKHVVIRLHRMNDYMLKDVGLTRLDDAHSLPFRRSDEEDS